MWRRLGTALLKDNLACLIDGKLGLSWAGPDDGSFLMLNNDSTIKTDKTDLHSENKKYNEHTLFNLKDSCVEHF